MGKAYLHVGQASRKAEEKSEVDYSVIVIPFFSCRNRPKNDKCFSPTS